MLCSLERTFGYVGGSQPRRNQPVIVRHHRDHNSQPSQRAREVSDPCSSAGSLQHGLTGTRAELCCEQTRSLLAIWPGRRGGPICAQAALKLLATIQRMHGGGGTDARCIRIQHEPADALAAARHATHANVKMLDDCRAPSLAFASIRCCRNDPRLPSAAAPFASLRRGLGIAHAPRVQPGIGDSSRLPACHRCTVAAVTPSDTVPSPRPLQPVRYLTADCVSDRAPSVSSSVPERGVRAPQLGSARDSRFGSCPRVFCSSASDTSVGLVAAVLAMPPAKGGAAAKRTAQANGTASVPRPYTRASADLSSCIVVRRQRTPCCIPLRWPGLCLTDQR